MLITKLFNFSRKTHKLIHFNKINLFLFTDNVPKTSKSNTQLLHEVLKQVQMKQQSSIFMNQGQQMQRIKKKRLTKSDKLKLGLFIPKMALNPRLNIQNQHIYRQKICQNLYDLQKQTLQTKVKILQKPTDTQRFTLDKYINSVYKDVYSRYLISKGVGVEWNGRYSTYGMLNSKDLQSSPKQLVVNFLKANISQIQKTKSIAPYSYLTQKYVQSDLIEVENLRKIGYYIRLPLSYFGDYQKHFQKILEKGSKAELLVFCEYLEKLIDPQCLCISPDKKMIILKRIIKENVSKSVKQSQSSSLGATNEVSLKYDFLITSLEGYNKHKQFFTNKDYQKHLIFDSNHMVGMKVKYPDLINNQKEQQKLLPIIGDIEGYERNAGFYIVNGSTSIPDYQRVKQLENSQEILKMMKNPFSNLGRLQVNNNDSMKLDKDNNHDNKIKNNLYVLDIQLQQKLLQTLKQTLIFEQVYDVFQDQVYSHKQTKQLLKFRPFDKYQIPIKQTSYHTLQNHFSQSSLSLNDLHVFQSKVKLPQFKKYNKPRQRRLLKKQTRQKLKQKTQYMTLMQSIKSIQNIPVSSSILGDMRVLFEKDQNGDIVEIYEKQSVEVDQNKDDKNNKNNQNIEQVMLSTDLISALTYMYQVQSQNKDLNCIIIQPQTFTQEILPLCIHLGLFKTALSSQTDKKGRTRHKKQHKHISKVLQSLKMIYLHPTISYSQKDIQVDSFISGSLKIINKRDFGYGFQAIRLWVCRNSDYLGDRQLKQKQVNQQLKNCAFIRKLYAEILPLMPKSQSLNIVDTMVDMQNLNLLDKFMLNQIDAYIQNMEYFYAKLMIKQAYQYTIDFYKNVIQQIYLQTVRKNIIAYPNSIQNLQHSITIKRILQLLAVISPLFPFSAYHISRQQIMKWSQLRQKQKYYENLLEYNSLVKIRTQLRNKLEVNTFKHSEIVFPLNNELNYSQKDLRLFFGVDKVSFEQPQIKHKKFGLNLGHNQTLGGRYKIQVYQSKQNCIRCDPQSKQKQHLCHNCVSYLENNVGKEIEFYNPRLNSLLFEEGQNQTTHNKSTQDITNPKLDTI